MGTCQSTISSTGQGRVFAIDFPQAVDFSSKVDQHKRLKEAGPLLLRDLKNLENHFAPHNVRIDAEAEYRKLMSNHESFVGPQRAFHG